MDPVSAKHASDRLGSATGTCVANCALPVEVQAAHCALSNASSNRSSLASSCSVLGTDGVPTDGPSGVGPLLLEQLCR